MDLKCTLETRVSKEGKEYEVVVLKLSEHSEKLIFLQPAEKELLKMHYVKKDNDELPNWM